MVGFRQLLEFVLDVDDKASAKFNQIGKAADRNLGQVPGHTTKIGTAMDAAAAKSPLLAKGLDKVGLSGQQAGSAIGSAMPTAALAASAAVGAFAVHAVGKFQDLGQSVLDFQRIVGGSAEESSAFVAVLDDYEISAEAGASAISKMARAAANTPEVFAKFGVEIAKNADGTTDLQGTLLNAAEAYQSTNDSATKAALGAALFGRGYATLIPILEQGADGADGLAEAFANVEGQQILSQSQIDQAESTRLALDSLKDSANELTLAFGSALSPAVGGFASSLSGLINVANKGAGSFGGLGTSIDLAARTALPFIFDFERAKSIFTGSASAVDRFGSAVSQIPIVGLGAGNAISMIDGQTQALSMSMITSAKVQGVLAEKTAAFGSSTVAVEHALGLEATAHSMNAGKALANAIAEDTAAAAAKDAAAASKAVDDALRDEAAAHRDAAAAIFERADAMRASADKTFAVRSATDEFRDAVSNLDADLQAAAEAGTSNEDSLRNQAIVLDEGAQKAGDMAQSVVDLAVEQSAGVGITSKASEQTDLWNQQMVDAASTAEGPLRDSIIDYVAEVNQIPPEKASEILALIAAGELDAAKALLDGASEKRIAEIEAEAEVAAANAALDAVANKVRTALIKAQVTAHYAIEDSNANKSASTGGNRSLGTGRAVAEQVETQRALSVAIRATTDALEDQSEAMSKAFDVVLAARKAEFDYAAAIASSDNQLESYTDTMNDAEASAADRLKAGIDLEKQLQAEAEKFVQMQEAIAAANGETYTAEQQVADYNHALGMLKQRFPELSNVIDGYAITLQELVGTIDQVALAQAAAEAATEAATEAYEAQQDALNDHTSDVLDSLQAERDYATAVLDTKQTIADYLAILADPTATADEQLRAKLELANQVDAEADAWVRLKEAQAEANGVEFTAEDRIAAYNEALAKLNARPIPFVPGSSVWTGGGWSNPIGTLGTPLGATNRMGQASGGQSSMFNITVNAGLGSNGTQIGNELVRVLREWERSNGPILVR